ncbi:lipase 1 [Scaptodrosophila lebanonensis]|uniref:Lipase 1 n=1 Tax=Drosophila lebanonensis TaxID=7225 RepID=A0A6J2U3P0_DROLE|nr:lipase 1 [Scaptodrosophila lebanonensis]
MSAVGREKFTHCIIVFALVISQTVLACSPRPPNVAPIFRRNNKNTQPSVALNERHKWTTNDWLEHHNYSYERHNVTTSDGYQLQLQRLPRHGAQPVLLLHGLLSSSLAWVCLGPDKSLAFQLHQRQYDVWLANLRGSTPYARRHVEFTDVMSEFWRYSFHEHGAYDLAAIIDHIGKVTAAPNHEVGERPEKAAQPGTEREEIDEDAELGEEEPEIPTNEDGKVGEEEREEVDANDQEEQEETEQGKDSKSGEEADQNDQHDQREQEPKHPDSDKTSKEVTEKRNKDGEQREKTDEKENAQEEPDELEQNKSNEEDLPKEEPDLREYDELRQRQEEHSLLVAKQHQHQLQKPNQRARQRLQKQKRRHQQGHHHGHPQKQQHQQLQPKREPPPVVLIGHSQAFNAFLVLCALQPRYNQRILLMQALAPLARLRHYARFDNSQVLRVMKFIKQRQKANKYELFPVGELRKYCFQSGAKKQDLCEHYAKHLIGSALNNNKLLEPFKFEYLLQGGSARELQHLQQIWKSGDFIAYDYGHIDNLQIYHSVEAPGYNLSKVTVPLILYFGETDAIATPEGVHSIYAKMVQSVRSVRRIAANKFNHLDFVLANDVKNLVNDKLIELMEKFLEGKLPYIIE